MSKRAPYSFSPPSHDGPQWTLAFRSLEERAKSGDPTLKAELAREFPAGHFTTPPSAESADVSRRGFLTLASAALALAGAEGCRRPVEKILPYQKMPEQVIPGVASHYATVMNRRGEALGLLVESHEGRPTKIEGNPEHPASNPELAPPQKRSPNGGTDLLTQAAILDLYDMDRSTTPIQKGQPATWEDAEHALADALKKHAVQGGDGGAKLRVLMQPTNSPSILRMRAAFMTKFPKARVQTYAPVADSNANEGARLAFGTPKRALAMYDRAKVIVSLDCDFLQTEAGSVRATKQFAAGRRLRSNGDSMSRLYCIEPSLTTTGANADHRLRAPASDIAGLALALAKALSTSRARLADIAADAAGNVGLPGATEWIAALAKDMVRAPSVVVVGSRQPAFVHAIAHAINEALGSVGTTLQYVDVTDADEKDSVKEIADLADAIAKNQVETLVLIGGNPVYDAPADLKIGEAIARVPLTIHLASLLDETGDKCTWHLPRAHELEAWGDQRSLDGTIAIQQPLIAPLHGGKSDLEIFAMLAGETEANGYDVVRGTMRANLLASKGVTDCGPVVGGKAECKDGQGNKFDFVMGDLEHDWKRALRDGFLTRRQSQPNMGGGGVQTAAVVAELKLASKKGVLGTPISKDSLEVTFAPCQKMFDGRHANNVWLMELPEPLTKICWDNAALIHPATAKDLGVETGDLVKLTVGDRSITIAVFVFPGQAANSIGLSLGWGRTKAGRIGSGKDDTRKGFDVYPLRTSTAMGFATGAKLAKTGDRYTLGSTHSYPWEEGRPIAREATIEEYKQHPNFPDLQTPPPRALPLWHDQDYTKGLQWGMNIDLNSCTGCNACVVACQAENNVPVVGKIEVARGREMSWLRIDRYFVYPNDNSRKKPEGDADKQREQELLSEEPQFVFQPLACVHCEEAPCENVCPVNATVHSPEGLNEMVYNRCIGTRYCANNCPYKVRRFNYLNWHNDSVWKAEGDIPETLKMQQNPNVSVRFRGIMEKCSYCVQRIQTAKIAAKRNNEMKDDYVAVRDGAIVTACEQACPADAIVFGDLNDPNTRVAKLARLDRRYALLGEIGTKPRTTYLGKVRNPNKEMPGVAPAGLTPTPAEKKEHG